MHWRIEWHDEPQILSCLFAAVCRYLHYQHLTTTAYQPQAYGQKEWFNNTIVARLPHYVAENQTDWDPFVQPLTYVYST